MSLDVKKGDRFGLLVVLEVRRDCLCRCDCGKEKRIYKPDLFYGKTKSCGCASSVLAKQTFQEKYGVDSPMQNKEVLRKAQQTNLERYGNICSAHGDEQIAAKQKTWLKNLGVDNPLKSKKIQKKLKETMLEHHGVQSPLQSKEIREKFKQTMTDRFGVTNALKSEILKDKARDTCRERYGANNPMQNAEIKERSYKTKQNNGSDRASKGELELLSWVKSIDPDVRKAYIGGVEFDIASFSRKILIEYNGLYWHSEAVGRDKAYHVRKSEIGRKCGYQVIHIWEHEWEKRPEAVKSYILSKFGKNSTTIGARKCSFVKIGADVAAKACADWHIQGAPVNTALALGCFSGKDLIGVATFGPNPRKSAEANLTRLCFRPGVTVSGALSKFSKLAYVALNVDIFTFVKLDKSSAASYLASGWEVYKTLPPDYFYYSQDNKGAISKQSRRKSAVKTPDGVTEKEHAQQDGLYRIWDCGKIKLRYSGKISTQLQRPQVET